MRSATEPVAGERIHFIAEWLERRGMSQADVVRELGVNKGTVSKWCRGDLPGEDNLRALAALLNVGPSDLFRHPLDDWMSRFFMHRSAEQLKRMVDTLKAAFPEEGGAPPGESAAAQDGRRSPAPAAGTRRRGDSR